MSNITGFFYWSSFLILQNIAVPDCNKVNFLFIHIMSFRRRSSMKQRRDKLSDKIDSFEQMKKTFFTSRSLKSSPSNTFEDKNSSRQIELPLVPCKQVLSKIGGLPKQAYLPKDEEYNARHSAKQLELRNLYFKPQISRNSKPFKHELDEIVLGCFEYGKLPLCENVWKKYKQNFDELTYDTLCVIANKRKL